MSPTFDIDGKRIWPESIRPEALVSPVRVVLGRPDGGPGVAIATDTGGSAVLWFNTSTKKLVVTHDGEDTVIGP